MEVTYLWQPYYPDGCLENREKTRKSSVWMGSNEAEVGSRHLANTSSECYRYNSYLCPDIRRTQDNRSLLPPCGGGLEYLHRSPCES
jgi:hypothetical protein